MTLARAGLARGREGAREEGKAHGPVCLDPVLEAECGTLPDWLVLGWILAQLEDEGPEGRVSLRLEEVALCLTPGWCVGREGGDEYACERVELCHGSRAE